MKKIIMLLVLSSLGSTSAYAGNRVISSASWNKLIDYTLVSLWDGWKNRGQPTVENPDGSKSGVLDVSYAPSERRDPSSRGGSRNESGRDNSGSDATPSENSNGSDRDNKSEDSAGTSSSNSGSGNSSNDDSDSNDSDSNDSDSNDSDSNDSDDDNCTGGCKSDDEDDDDDSSTPSNGGDQMTGDPEGDIPYDPNYPGPRKKRRTSGGMTWRPLDGLRDPVKGDEGNNSGQGNSSGRGPIFVLPGGGVTDPGFDGDDHVPSRSGGSGGIFVLPGRGVIDPPKTDIFRPKVKDLDSIVRGRDKFIPKKSLDRFR